MIGSSHFAVTDHFAVIRGEDAETSPGRYGREFSAWVSEQFQARGETVSAVIPEDFGWSVVLREGPVRYWVACGDRDGSSNEWGAYLVVEQSLLSRVFKRVNVHPEFERLSALLSSIMASVPGARAHTLEDV